MDKGKDRYYISVEMGKQMLGGLLGPTVLETINSMDGYDKGLKRKDDK